MPATWSTDELTTTAKESYREHEGERVTEPGSEVLLRRRLLRLCCPADHWSCVYLVVGRTADRGSRHEYRGRATME